MSESLTAWHDFYIAQAAASATFAGLLFVGIALHVRLITSHRDVRRLARLTLSGFVTVTIISLVLLIPSHTPMSLGVSLIAIAAFSLLTLGPAAVEAIWTERRRALPRRLMISRFITGVLVVIGLGIDGVVIATGELDRGLLALVFLGVAMIFICVRNSWDLLVTLAG